MRALSIGVQAATMIDCPVRVPLLVYAKIRKIDVKDPVDLVAVRRGRLIHAAFETVATRLAAEGLLSEEGVMKAELERKIAASLPDLEPSIVTAQASSLAATVSASVQAEPTRKVEHEHRFSIALVSGINVTGRIDTILDGTDGWTIVERKTGTRYPWHARQVQLYAEMVSEKHPETRVSRLELWYSGRDAGIIVVPCTRGEIIGELRELTRRGQALDDRGAGQIILTRCKQCPRADCGVRRLANIIRRIS
jgi:RecB family exonuclease